MVTLVDDQELSRLLRLSSPEPAEPIFTTGLWYLRLCQALVETRSTSGRLSAPFAQLPEPQRTRAFHAVIALPDPIGVVSLRDLGPLMAQLRSEHRLNLLSAEALAAAIHLGAEVHLSGPAPLLEESLAHHECSVRRLDIE